MYKSVKTALMALTVFAVGTSISFADTNLLSNWHFDGAWEEGDIPEGWIWTPTNDRIFQRDIDPLLGTYNVGLEPVGSHNVFQQDIVGIEETTYYAAIMARGVDGVQVRVGIRRDGHNQYGSYSALTDSEWTSVSVSRDSINGADDAMLISVLESAEGDRPIIDIGAAWFGTTLPPAGWPTAPFAATSSISNQTKGADGSKQVTLTITVANAAGEGIDGYVATDFGVEIDGGLAVDFSGAPFSGFNDNADGTYTVVYTGAADDTAYDFENLTVDGYLLEAGPVAVTTPEAEAAVTNASINPTTENYNLDTPANVTTTITWNDAAAVTSISDGEDTLTVADDYTVTDIDGATATLTILNSWLLEELGQAGDDVELTINFDEGDSASFTITATAAAPVLLGAETNAAGTVITLEFDKDMANPSGKHAEFTFSVDGGAPRGFSGAAIDGDAKKINLTIDDVAVEFGDVVTVSYTLGTVLCDLGGVLASFTDQAVTNNVPADNATINPIAEEYDLDAPANVTTVITWNDATEVSSISDGTGGLDLTDDYTVTDIDGVTATLTILNSWLSTELLQVDDEVELTINFDEGDSAVFTITAIGAEGLGYDAGLLTAELHDPSFESDIHKWSFTATDTTYGSTTDPAKYGSRTFRGTSCTTSYINRVLRTDNFITGIDESREYTLEVWAYHAGNEWEDTLIELNIEWYDDSDTLIDTSTEDGIGFDAQSTWELKTLTAQTPAEAEKAKIQIRWKRTTGTESGRQISFDGVAFIEASVVDASISPTTENYSLDAPANVTTEITWNDATEITSISDGEDTLTVGDDYTVTDIDGATATLTILNSWLLEELGQAGDDVELTINFDEGDSASFTITAIAAAPVLVGAETNAAGTVITLEFDKDMADPSGQHVGFKFSVDGGSNREFSAAALDGGDATKINLTIDGAAVAFGDVITVNYTLNIVLCELGGVLATFNNQAVINNVPADNATINPIAEDYDLDAPANVTTVITWNDATEVSSISDGTGGLDLTDDYTVTDIDGVTATLTILNSWLSTELLQVDDEVELTINFDEGASAVFTITAIGAEGLGAEGLGYDAGLLTAELHDPSFEDPNGVGVFWATNTHTDANYAHSGASLYGDFSFRWDNATLGFDGRYLTLVNPVEGVDGDKAYLVSANLFSSSVNWDNLAFRIDVDWYDAEDLLISSSEGSEQVLDEQSTWEEKSEIFISPEDAEKAVIVLRSRRLGEGTVIHYIDGVSFKNVPHTGKLITQFDFEALDPTVVGVIDNAEETITLTVPAETVVTDLVPTIGVSLGASVAPLSGVAQDFTTPVEYTVTAEDDSTKVYTVTVIAADIVNAEVTPSASVYLLYAPDDVETTITLNDGGSVTSVSVGIDVLTEGAEDDYVIDGSTLRIFDSYLSEALTEAGNSVQFDIEFEHGDAAEFTVTAIGIDAGNSTVSRFNDLPVQADDDNVELFLYLQDTDEDPVNATLNVRVSESEAGDWMSSDEVSFNASGNATLFLTATSADVYEGVSVEVETSAGVWEEIGVFDVTITANDAVNMVSDPDTFTEIAQGGSQLFTVTVTDVYGNPVSGEIIAFGVAGAGEAGTVFTSAEETTDVLGQASSTLNVDESEGIEDDKLIITIGHGSIDNIVFSDVDVVAGLTASAVTLDGPSIITADNTVVVSTYTATLDEEVAGANIKFILLGLDSGDIDDISEGDVVNLLNPAVGVDIASDASGEAELIITFAAGVDKQFAIEAHIDDSDPIVGTTTDDHIVVLLDTTEAPVIRALRWDGEATLVDSPFYYNYFDNGYDIQFVVENLGSYVTEVVADFSNLDGPAAVQGSAIVEGASVISFDWSAEGLGDDQAGAAHSIPVVMETPGGTFPLYNFTVVNINPVDMDGLGLAGDTTDWSAMESDFDFTEAEGLVFEKVIDGTPIGKLVLNEAINLCDEATVSGLTALGANLTIAAGEMSINTAAEALAAFDVASTLYMYNLNFRGVPSVRYIPDVGESEVVVEAGSIIEPAKVDTFNWIEEENTLVLGVNEWSGYQAFDSIPNMLANWAFEDWELDNTKPVDWTGSHSFGTNWYRSQDSLLGNYSVRVNGNGARRLDQKDLPSVEPSKTYYASVWVKGTGDVKIGIVRQTGSVDWEDSVTLSEDGWTELTAELTMTATPGAGGGLSIETTDAGGETTADTIFIGAAWLSDEEPPADWPRIIDPENSSFVSYEQGEQESKSVKLEIEVRRDDMLGIGGYAAADFELRVDSGALIDFTNEMFSEFTFEGNGVYTVVAEFAESNESYDLSDLTVDGILVDDSEFTVETPPDLRGLLLTFENTYIQGVAELYPSSEEIWDAIARTDHNEGDFQELELNLAGVGTFPLIYDKGVWKTGTQVGSLQLPPYAPGTAVFVASDLEGPIGSFDWIGIENMIRPSSGPVMATPDGAVWSMRDGQPVLNISSAVALDEISWAAMDIGGAEPEHSGIEVEITGPGEYDYFQELTSTDTSVSIAPFITEGEYTISIMFSVADITEEGTGTGILDDYREIYNILEKTFITVLVREIPDAEESTVGTPESVYNPGMFEVGIPFEFDVTVRNSEEDPITGLDIYDFELDLTAGEGTLTLTSVVADGEFPGVYNLTAEYDTDETIDFNVLVTGISIGSVTELEIEEYKMPAPKSAVTDGSSIVIEFNKPLISGSANAGSYFSYTRTLGEDTLDSDGILNSINIVNEFVTLFITSDNPQYEEIITVSYNGHGEGILESQDTGAEVANFDNFVVSNEVIGGAHEVVAAAEFEDPTAGTPNQITLTVYDSEEEVDESFAGSVNVTVSGYSTSPLGDIGSFNAEELTEEVTVVEVVFVDGVAGANLILKHAALQSIVFEVENVRNPETEPLDITPTHGTPDNLIISVQPIPDRRDGTVPVPLKEQPEVIVRDEYGNNATSYAGSIAAAAHNPGEWTLTGASASVDNGVALFTDLAVATVSDEDFEGAIIGFSEADVNGYDLGTALSDPFDLIDFPAPELVSPSDGDHINTPNFVWSDTEAAEYKLEISENSDMSSPEEFTASTTSYTAESLNEGIYYWRVRGFDGVDKHSQFSSTRQFTLDTTAPDKPALSIVSMDKANEVIFDISSNDTFTSDEELEFVLKIGPDGAFEGGPTENFTGVSTHSVVLSSPNASVSFRVRAYDKAGNQSVYSENITTVTYANAPTGTSVEVFVSSATISWDSDNPEGTVWQIVRADNSKFAGAETVLNLSAVHTALSFTDKELDQGKSYWWKVQAVNSVGMLSDFDDPVSGTMPDWPTLVSPADGYITRPDTITFLWSAVEASVEDYQIQFAEDREFTLGGSITLIGSTGTTTDVYSDDAEGVWYWRVRAVYDISGGDYSEWSSERKITVSTTPPTVDSLEVSDLGRHSFTLTADVTAGFVDLTTAPYKVKLSTHSDFSELYVDAVWTNELVYNFDELITGTTYYYRITVEDLAGFVVQMDSQTVTDAVEVVTSEEIEKLETVTGGRVTLTVPEAQSTIRVYAEIRAPSAFDLDIIETANGKLALGNYRVGPVSPMDYKLLDERGVAVQSDKFADPGNKIVIRFEFDEDLTEREAAALRVARLDTNAEEWELVDKEDTTVNLPGKYVDVRLDSLSIYTLVLEPFDADVEIISEAYVYPNPFKPGDEDFGSLGGDGIVIAEVPEGSNIRVFTMAGELVHSFKTDAPNEYRWTRAEDLASGVYIMVIEYDGDTKNLKFAVVK